MYYLSAPSLFLTIICIKSVIKMDITSWVMDLGDKTKKYVLASLYYLSFNICSKQNMFVFRLNFLQKKWHAD